MKVQNPFKLLNKFETALLVTSVITVLISGFFTGIDGIANTICSLIGVVSLIFVAKGHVFGMALCTVFAFFYGIISLSVNYYGEAITYMCMSAPMNIIALVSWLKNPYKDTAEVKVAKMTKGKIVFMTLSAAVVTTVFYFVLSFLNTPSIVFSTMSITTSFIAVAFTYFRSPYYALGYALNDVVLIALWTIKCFSDVSYIPMTMCFVMFLANDLYGLYNWKRMQHRQIENK